MTLRDQVEKEKAFDKPVSGIDHPQTGERGDPPLQAGATEQHAGRGHPTLRQATLSNETRGEHDALLVAMHRLEAALAAAAPGRQQAWGARVQNDLRLVQEALARHVASAEGSDGLLASIDLSRPAIVRRVERLRREHADLLQQANDLQRRVERLCSVEWTAYEACLADEVLDDPDAADIRLPTAQLLSALRSHQAHESDLIFETFYTDIGAGD